MLRSYITGKRLCIFISSTEHSAVQALGKFSTVETVRVKPMICLNPISALQAKAEQSILGASWDTWSARV